MKVLIQLIQITKSPKNKNCWLDVAVYPQLMAEYSALIQDYDFVDFEGEVFYYDVISKYDLGFNKTFLKRYKSSSVIVRKENLSEFFEFITSGNKEGIQTDFIEGRTIILIDY